jgi:hypothetical protein
MKRKFFLFCVPLSAGCENAPVSRVSYVETAKGQKFLPPDPLFLFALLLFGLRLEIFCGGLSDKIRTFFQDNPNVNF